MQLAPSSTAAVRSSGRVPPHAPSDVYGSGIRDFVPARELVRTSLLHRPAFGILVLLLCTAFTLCGDATADTSPKNKEAAPAAGPAAPIRIKPGTAFTEFPDWVACAAFSPDGRQVAAGSYGVCKLFDTAAGKELATLAEKAGFVRAAAFSPDGKVLATGSYQVVVLWDVATRQPLRSLAGHQGYVTGIAFSSEGTLLATSSEDETVRVWNPMTGAVVHKLTGHSRAVTGVAFSPDGKQLASCSGDVTRPTKQGEVKLWDTTTGAELATITGHDKAMTAVAFSPDGKTLATASFDETIKLWDPATGKELRTLEGHSRPVNAIAFLADRRTLASAGGGRNVGRNLVMLWDLQTGEERASFENHEGPVTTIAVSADGKRMVSGSHDKTALLWELASQETTVAAAQPASSGESAPEKSEKTPAAATDAKPATTGPAAAGADEKVKELRCGIIGLDTSHAIAFTQALNDEKAADDISHCRVIAAYPKGSPDIESSTKRVPEYTKTLQEMGVEMVDSIDELLKKVDVVLLETNDGRPHFEQVLPVLKAGKPVFIDKPIAASLSDAIAIFEASARYKVPLFSSSSLRYTKNAQALRNGKIGDIVGCDAYSPCSLEATHPDLYWYGIHGVETLFTVMGTGCEKVTRLSTPGTDLAAGVWKDGRIGTFRGMRAGKPGYGALAFGTTGNEQVGSYEGYRPLVVEIVKYFRTGVAPISPEETLEIYAFMEAADESKRQGGVPVTLESVMTRAREAAKAKSDK